MNEQKIVQFDPSVYKERREGLRSMLIEKWLADRIFFILWHPQPMWAISDGPVSDFKTTNVSDSNFLYYIWPSGVEASACAGAVMDIETWYTRVFGDAITIDDSIWVGDQVVDTKSFANDFLEYGWTSEDLLNEIVDNKGRLEYMPMIASDKLLYWSQKLSFSPEALQLWSSKELIQAVADQRVKKSPEEIELMTAEWDVTTEIHNLTSQAVKAWQLHTEQEVYGFIIGEIAKRWKVPAFPPIVTTNGAVLHNRQVRNIPFKKNDLLLLDFGTKDPVSGLCADQTSTIPVAEKFSPKQEDIYSIVYDAHKISRDACALWVRFEDMHKIAAERITQGLLDLGLLKWGTAEELVKLWVHKLFLPHGLGHAIWVDTHDMGDQNEKAIWYPDITRDKANNPLHAVRFNRILEVWHCFSIEPGIYFIPALMKQWKESNKFAEYINREAVEAYASEISGMRYEECYHMTEHGCEKLGTIKKKL